MKGGFISEDLEMISRKVEEDWRNNTKEKGERVRKGAGEGWQDGQGMKLGPGRDTPFEKRFVSIHGLVWCKNKVPIVIVPFGVKTFHSFIKVTISNL